MLYCLRVREAFFNSLFKCTGAIPEELFGGLHGSAEELSSRLSVPLAGPIAPGGFLAALHSPDASHGPGFGVEKDLQAPSDDFQGQVKPSCPIQTTSDGR